MFGIFNSILTGNLTLEIYLICLLTALVCGGLTAFAVSFRNQVSKSFLVALILLPMIVDTVITMVNGNIGTGVAVAGAFSLIRFRSAPGKARDITAIFLTMTAGLACAAGYIGPALLFTLITGVILLILNLIPMGEDRLLDLNITIPESLHFANAFDDLFQEYTKRCRLVKTRTSNMGSLYKLLYKVELKDRNQMQEFIDKLRCRNGNLEISLREQAEESDIL